MELYTIDIRSWTASFRYPNLISGIQPTLEVPPLSTILGLINAAAGFYINYKELSIGYYFEYQGKEMDLETIYMIDNNKGKPKNEAKSNVIKREFLFENLLRIYTTDEAIVNYLKYPVYPLVLGRMNDLASVDVKGIHKKELQEIENADKIRGQIIPFTNNHLPGVIQALPKYFSDTIPRQNIGTESYSILNHHSKVKSNLKAYRDVIGKNEVDIYMHHLNFANM
ncbi:MAG: type I-B CRISPR-associated protein Cas5 [Hydrotalea sp. AMD]|uniref:type I-B CRISPR-associated protein Cas5b n=1 Tax=Hydrotalea sp. AMD TaxID=2501297 RepID=UPI000943DC56|nr:type I-B CRISPR-associated protein Cas5b [Hydrotalea sp. AMD]RWZ90910.1 MAG: type I-B CRISPR-associated protein Cas5 [Hydrotalea sp. AMD]